MLISFSGTYQDPALRQYFSLLGKHFSLIDINSISKNHQLDKDLADILQKRQDLWFKLSPFDAQIAALESDLNQLRDLLKLNTGTDSSSNAKADSSFSDSLEAERQQYQSRLKSLECEAVELLLEHSWLDDPVDSLAANATLEVSSGVGGQEAMLFARELFASYLEYAQFRGWPVASTPDAFAVDEVELGGCRRGFVRFDSPEAYAWLKYEGGVHRVQRVPVTERTGRMHTSTAVVVVLPCAESESEGSSASASNKPWADLPLAPSDLVISTFSSSGPGGQHVNKTQSAVRIVHKPTGLVAESQEERYQPLNKAHALNRLRKR